jgi:membrane protein DedA with SNARE-associated domain
VVDGFLDWLAGLHAVTVSLVLILLSALENVFPPVPADVAVALGALLAQRRGGSPGLIGALCWAANTASSAGMYMLGRKYGEAFFATGWPRKLLPPEAMKALHEAYARHGVEGIFVSRFLPGLRAAVTPFAGVAGLSPARALIPAATASAIWYALIVAAGSALGLQWEAVKALVNRANQLLALVALAAAAAVLLWIWRRTRAR